MKIRVTKDEEHLLKFAFESNDKPKLISYGDKDYNKLVEFIIKNVNKDTSNVFIQLFDDKKNKPFTSVRRDKKFKYDDLLKRLIMFNIAETKTMFSASLYRSILNNVEAFEETQDTSVLAFNDNQRKEYLKSMYRQMQTLTTIKTKISALNQSVKCMVALDEKKGLLSKDYNLDLWHLIKIDTTSDLEQEILTYEMLLDHVMNAPVDIEYRWQYLAVPLLCFKGVRIDKGAEEINHIRITDIEDGKLHIGGKYERTIELTPFEYNVLRKTITDAPGMNDYLFRSLNYRQYEDGNNPSEPLSLWTIRKRIIDLQKSVHVKNMDYRYLRRSGQVDVYSKIAKNVYGSFTTLRKRDSSAIAKQTLLDTAEYEDESAPGFKAASEKLTNMYRRYVFELSKGFNTRFKAVDGEVVDKVDTTLPTKTGIEGLRKDKPEESKKKEKSEKENKPKSEDLQVLTHEDVESFTLDDFRIFHS